MTVYSFPAQGGQPMRQQVAENIRALMARRGVRQPQMMALLGLSQPAVSRRLNGQLPWNVDELDVVAQAFDVSVAELVGGQPKRPHPDGPDGGVSESVRHQGLEPRTRCYEAIAA